MLATAAGVAVTRFTWPLFAGTPFAPLFAAVAATTHWGSGPAGLLAILLSVAGAPFAFPAGGPSEWNPRTLATFVPVALFASRIIARRNRSAAALRASEADLRATWEQARDSEQKLRRAQKMEAVGQLVAGVAHNFTTIVLISPNLAASRDASNADSPAKIFAQKKIAPRRATAGRNRPPEERSGDPARDMTGLSGLACNGGVMRMNRFLTLGALAAGLLGVLGAAGQQQPVFRGGNDAVRVFVTVTDRDGRLVTTLTREQFEVRDEGKPQPITQFDNTPQPIRLIVMLDVSGSMEGNLPLLREASAQLFARLRPDDVARVGSFGHEVTISPSFTHDPDELAAALPAGIAPDAPTPLWRAIDEAMDAFGKDDDERKVILVLSDGKDTGPLSFRHRPSSQADVIDRARRDDVMIYAVGMRSRSRQPMSPGIGRGGLQAMLLADLPDPGLARVAEETGGGYIEIRFGQDLGAAFAAVADELHTQYLLGYAPPKRDGKVHDISVRVTQGGLKPRARKSYVAPKE